MTAVATALAIAIALGLAAALALDPRARGARLLGLAISFGIAGCALAVGALSAAGVAWSRTSVAVAAAILLVIAVAAAIARRRSPGDATPRETSRSGPVPWTLAAATATLVAGHAVYATLAPPGEWDFWAIWGLKAKVFHQVAAVDWQWLQRPANRFAHPDYPLLLPLAYDFVASLAGSWPERQLGLLFTAFAASVLLIAAAHVREASGSSLLASAGALAMAGPVLNLPGALGLADLPLLAFGTIGLLELRSAIVDGRNERLGVAAAALLCAAMTKNEGIALVVAAAIATIVGGGARRWRLQVVFVPAALAALGWILAGRAHGLGNDLFVGDVIARIAASARAPRVILQNLAENAPRYPLFWIAIVLAIAVAGARRLVRERFLLVAIALQLAFFLAAYLITPHDVGWHIASSWPRLVGQLIAPAAFLAILFAGDFFQERRKDSAPG